MLKSCALVVAVLLLALVRRGVCHRGRLMVVVLVHEYSARYGNDWRTHPASPVTSGPGEHRGHKEKSTQAARARAIPFLRGPVAKCEFKKCSSGRSPTFDSCSHLFTSAAQQHGLGLRQQQTNKQQQRRNIEQTETPYTLAGHVRARPHNHTHATERTLGQLVAAG